MNERVWVLIDGSNLYYKLKDSEIGLNSTLDFDYRGLCKWLSRDRDLKSSRYYVGVVRAKREDIKGQRMVRNQQRLFAHLSSKNQGFEIQKGYIMKNVIPITKKVLMCNLPLIF